MGISYLIKAVKLMFCSKQNVEWQTGKIVKNVFNATGALMRQSIGFRITEEQNDNLVQIVQLLAGNVA